MLGDVSLSVCGFLGRVWDVERCDGVRFFFPPSKKGGMRVMVLQAESADEMNDWIKTVSAGISAQLDALLPSDVSGTGASSGGNGSSAEGDAQRERQLTVITETPGNDKCADCNNMEGVEWCSLNLGVVLCLECAGVHRGLGVHISQCRSFKLDVMDESILSMFASIGNTVANQVWEETLQTVEQDLINIPEQGGFGGSGSFDASMKPTASSTRKEKETYVKNKYVERLYVNRTTQDNAEEIGTALIDAAAKGDMKKLVRHVAWKTNLDYVSVHGGKRSSVCRRCVVGVVCLCLLRCVFFCIFAFACTYPHVFFLLHLPPLPCASNSNGVVRSSPSWTSSTYHTLVVKPCRCE